MKVRIASKLPHVQIGSSSLTGKELTSFADNVGFAAYELTIEAGKGLKLVSPFGPNFNHIYYCFDGSGDATYADSNVVFVKNVVIALTGKMEMVVTASSRMKIFGAFVPEDSNATPQQQPMIRTLAEIIGGERDIDWTNGRSRRFLRKSDNFNISLHNTVAYPGFSSNLQYKNHYEVVYYIRGDIEYSWLGDSKKESCHFRQDSSAEGDGVMYIMDQHDAHTLRSGDLECECLCLFYPPLKGTETHSLSNDGYSSF